MINAQTPRANITMIALGHYVFLFSYAQLTAAMHKRNDQPYVLNKELGDVRWSNTTAKHCREFFGNFFQSDYREHGRLSIVNPDQIHHLFHKAALQSMGADKGDLMEMMEEVADDICGRSTKSIPMPSTRQLVGRMWDIFNNRGKDRPVTGLEGTIYGASMRDRMNYED